MKDYTGQTISTESYSLLFFPRPPTLLLDFTFCVLKAKKKRKKKSLMSRWLGKLSIVVLKLTFTATEEELQ